MTYCFDNRYIPATIYLKHFFAIILKGLINMTIAAFFDVDGTLYRDSLMIEHFKKLLKYEVFDPIIWHSDVKRVFSEWEKREGDYDTYMEELAEVYVNSLKGLNKYEYDFIVKQTIALCGDKVYSYTRKQIEYHKNLGHLVLFISGSPDYLVSKMADKYHADDFRASIYKVNENNEFTGEVIPMWDGLNKIKSMNELKNKYNIDFNKSYAYGDTNGDLKMLQTVKYPIAINPSFELINSIKNDDILNKNAKIIIERKNVIYELDSSSKIEKGGR
jgi:HAD superfamily hydrolase (TIGR01490 family)